MFLLPRPPQEAAVAQWLPLQMAAGLAATAVLFSIIGLGRVNYLALIWLAQFATAAWNWRQRLQLRGTASPTTAARPDLLAILIATLAVILLTALDHAWTTRNGKIGGINEDLGYFAQLAEALPEAKLATVWTAVLGRWTLEAGETSDVWYHWGAIWLVFGVSKLTGWPTLTALLSIVAPAINTVLVLLASRIVSQVSGRALRQSLVIGGVSLIAVTFPSMTEAALVGKWLPGNAMPHFHPSLAYQFSYKFEAVLVLAALSAWLGGRIWLAAGMLFIASVSAPHTVAGVGLAAGMLAVFAVLLRRRQMVLLAGGSVLTLIAAWASIHFLFGVDMPKTAEAKLIDLQGSALWKNSIEGLRDVCIGLLLIAPVFPGIWHLIRHGKDSQQVSLGWLALAALVGSYMAYHLLLPEGDRAHFTMYAHAFLVVPIGIWGLSALLAHDETFQRKMSTALLTFVAMTGIYELWGTRAWQSPMPIAAQDVAAVKEKLSGQQWGYFAERDRNWWIPQAASLAGILDSRCLRLNEIRDKDRESNAARFYGSGRLYDLVPEVAGESPLQWSTRLAAKLRIRYVVELDRAALPDDLHANLTEVLQVPGLRIYQWQSFPNWPESP